MVWAMEKAKNALVLHPAAAVFNGAPVVEMRWNWCKLAASRNRAQEF
jgi:hypothetical protein